MAELCLWSHPGFCECLGGYFFSGSASRLQAYKKAHLSARAGRCCVVHLVDFLTPLPCLLHPACSAPTSDPAAAASLSSLSQRLGEHAAAVASAAMDASVTLSDALLTLSSLSKDSFAHETSTRSKALQVGRGRLVLLDGRRVWARPSAQVKESGRLSSFTAAAGTRINIAEFIGHMFSTHCQGCIIASGVPCTAVAVSVLCMPHPLALDHSACSGHEPDPCACLVLCSRRYGAPQRSSWGASPASGRTPSCTSTASCSTACCTPPMVRLPCTKRGFPPT